MTNPPSLHALQIQSVLLSVITKQSIKTLLIVIASKAQALRGNPQIQKQAFSNPCFMTKRNLIHFKALLCDKTKPNLRFLQKSAYISKALCLEILNERI